MSKTATRRVAGYRPLRIDRVRSGRQGLHLMRSNGALQGLFRDTTCNNAGEYNIVDKAGSPWAAQFPVAWRVTYAEVAVLGE